MFHDMRYAGAVLWRCTEADAKHLVVIIILYQKHPGAAPLMSEQASAGADSFQFLLLNHLISSAICFVHNFCPTPFLILAHPFPHIITLFDFACNKKNGTALSVSSFLFLILFFTAFPVVMH